MAIVNVTPERKLICDRCGAEKEIKTFAEENNIHRVWFETANAYEYETIKKGYVCDKCYEDFKELAVNFFDEVNKGGE